MKLPGLAAATLLFASPLALAEPGVTKSNSALAEATFAGGCFWCMEHAFDEVEGVVSTDSGYTGGKTESPTYEEVSSGRTGHAESVRVVFDPAKVTYAELIVVFWHNIDPTDATGQFCDKGSQYRSAIFTRDEEQRRLAEESKRKLERSKPFPQPIVTEIVPLGEFTAAESYHQDFHEKNPVRYQYYRWGCGRDRRLEELWGEAAGKGTALTSRPSP